MSFKRIGNLETLTALSFLGLSILSNIQGKLSFLGLSILSNIQGKLTLEGKIKTN